MKNDIFTYIGHMEKRLNEANVRVLKNCLADRDFTASEKPDVIILATGGTPIRLNLPGLEKAVSAQNVFKTGPSELGQSVAVIGGGMVGCEVAEYVASTGRHVEIFEQPPEVAGDLFYTVRNALMERLQEFAVAIHAGSQVLRVDGGKIVFADSSGKVADAGPVESIVMAVGVRPEKSLAAVIKFLGIEYIKIGDCESQGNCRHATQMALMALNI